MTVAWLTGAIGLITPFASTAADPAGTTATDDDWQFKVQAYGWLPTIESTLPTGNELELEIDEIFDYLDMTFMGTFQARRNKWAIVTDLVYLKLSEDGAGNTTVPVPPPSGTPTRVDIGAEMETWIVNLAGSYRVYQTDKYDVQLLAGARYFYLDTKAELDTSIVPAGGVEVDADDDVWDGIVGVRGLANLNEKWWMTYRFDVGAGNSDLTWNAAAQFGRKYDWGSLAAGYRYLHYDFDSDFKPLKELDVYGPFIGAVWEF
jgi:hypothetical protein